jgi:hypothetical protein
MDRTQYFSTSTLLLDRQIARFAGLFRFGRIPFWRYFNAAAKRIAMSGKLWFRALSVS